MTTDSKKLNIAIAADHGAYQKRAAIVKHLRELGHTVIDHGTDSSDPVDYPNYALKVVADIKSRNADFGVLLCRSGIGMSISANRHPGIRAALLDNVEFARRSRQHNDANILCLADEKIDSVTANQIVDAFIAEPFEGGRHQRRVEKIEECAVHQDDAGLNMVAMTDPEIFAAIAAEKKRQTDNIELIASENFTSTAVMQAQGSCLTNKYAEGYPGRRWYGGCEHVDTVEQLAIDRALKLFGAEHANVQPHSGSQANAAVYFSQLQPGDAILTMDLSHGGHLTHGHPANFSGKFYSVTHYGVSEKDERIDYDHLADLAAKTKPKMITAGASAYPRIIDFARMAEIASSVNALLFVDMAHIAGLVAAGEHPSPVPYADFVTTTTHKSLRGPRGGLILCKKDYAKKIDAMVFPGIQGGPLMHVIAAKAVCLQEALQPDFADYQKKVIANCAALARHLSDHGYRIVSGGTDNHLLLVDLRPANINGAEAQITLDEAGITVNKNTIPFDTGSPFKPSGIRIGTPAVTTRGMGLDEMKKIADLIYRALSDKDNPENLEKIRGEICELNRAFPLP